MADLEQPKDDHSQPGRGDTDLRTLVEGLKTRSPEEVMGAAANSSLIGSIVTAAVGLICFLLAMTVVVFVSFGPPAVRKTADEKSPTESKPAVVQQSTTTTQAGADPKAAGVSKEKDETNDESGDAVKAMGIGETKDADSSTDSLDNRLDDLLKGLE